MKYEFGGEKEPLYRFALDYAAENEVDYFIFGHYHVGVDMILPSGARFLILKDWIKASPYLCFNGISLE